ncbi:MAG: peptidyl-alpha-hydroxyglycine alpha-amidating lyase family protein [Hyphomicrobiales bacterium]|jgi:peptidylamidoglycolate lyase
MKTSKRKIKVASFGLVICVGLALWWGATDTASIVPVNAMESTTTPTPDISFSSQVFWPSHEEEDGAIVTAVAIGPDGSVYVLHRANRAFGVDDTPINEPVIFRLDVETGEIIERFGAGLFVSPHGMSVAADGSIWVADVSLNIVAHLDTTGRLIAIYGKPYPFYLEALLRLRNVFTRLPVPMDDNTFARPTDVVPLANGRFAVTDGYRNSRLAVFDASGNLVWQINKRGSEPGAFHLPHGISADSAGHIYVADRRNARVQVFSDDGVLMRVISGAFAGRPYGVDVAANGCLYIADGGDSLDLKDDNFSPNMRAGFSVFSEDGIPIGRWGNTVDGPEDFLLPHDIAVGRDGRVYIADTDAEQVLAIDLAGHCEN